ncbi:MAG TPA: HEAT repeat domain-containing protein, partial [Fimbriimonadaceae bacterium]|nr:HEAT repeat domain-containing protein [Fimbriimonadaceae bacterium]
DDLPMRAAAVELIAKFPSALEIGRTMTGAADERMTRTGIDLLGKIGSPEALQIVGALLSDQRPGVRIQALLALHNRAPEEFKSAVIELRRDPDARVRAIAARIDPGR